MAVFTGIFNVGSFHGIRSELEKCSLRKSFPTYLDDELYNSFWSRLMHDIDPKS